MSPQNACFPALSISYIIACPQTAPTETRSLMVMLGHAAVQPEISMCPFCASNAPPQHGHPFAGGLQKVDFQELLHAAPKLQLLAPNMCNLLHLRCGTVAERQSSKGSVMTESVCLQNVLPVSCGHVYQWPAWMHSDTECTQVPTQVIGYLAALHMPDAHHSGTCHPVCDLASVSHAHTAVC